MSQTLEYASENIKCSECEQSITVTFTIEYDTETGETYRDLIPVRCDNCGYSVEPEDVA